MFRYLNYFVIIFFSGLTFGQEWPHADDTSNFGVRLLLVPDKEKFLEIWSKSSPPNIAVFNRAKVDSAFAVIVLYWGGGTDSAGSCDIDMELQIKEGETVIGSGAGIPICSGHKPPDSGRLGLADTIVDLVASGDPAQLIVQVTVTDKINLEKLTVSAPLEVVLE